MKNIHQPKTYFKGLNGLRFIAAFLVLMLHAELIRVKYGLFNLKDYSLFNCGHLAVEFFFVLSGFLITYLLLEEDRDTGTINIKSFYMRRVLRIWPLYYIILIIGLVLIPVAVRFMHIDYSFPFPVIAASLLFIFFLPNLVLSLWGSTFLAPLWSIGVEEQFYLFWAPVVKYFKRFLLFIFLFIITIRMIFYVSYDYFDSSNPTTSIILSFVKSLKFEAMSIGGLGAWLLYNYKEQVLRSKVFSIAAQFSLLAIIIARLVFHRSLLENTGWVGIVYGGLFNSSLSVIITSILFIWLILNISANPKTIINTDNKVLDFLGNISYGIYMYHSIVLFVVMIFLKNILPKLTPLWSTVLIYLVAGGLTILISYLSYRFIELKFLKFKKKFEPAKPGALEEVQIPAPSYR